MAFRWSDLLTNVVINIGVALLCLLIFNVLRNLGLFRKFYHAKRHLSIPFRFRPPELPKGFFKLGWMKNIFTMSDDKFVMCAGFDALTYCKFFSLCIRIMFVTTVLCMCVILPINLTGDQDISPGWNADTTVGQRTYNGFQATTIANIDQGSKRLWAHTGVMVIIAIAAMWLMNEHWKFAIKWRVLYNARTRKGTEGHTIMLQDIPGHVGMAGKAGKQIGKASKKMEKGMPSNADEAFFTDTHYDVYKHDLGSSNVHATSGGGLPGQIGPVTKEFPPPRDISERREIANYEPRPPPTDFEPWKQAEAAIGEGVRVEDIVRREFTRDFGPHAVQAVNVVPNCPDLDGAVADYDKSKTQLLDLADTYLCSMRAGKAPKRKEQKIKGLLSKDEEAANAWGTSGKVDKLEYLLWDVDRRYQHIRQLEGEVGGPETDSSAAFVTARTRLTQSVTTTGLLSFDEQYWNAAPAPAPNDVIWENVATRSSERKIRVAVGWAIFFGLVIVFLPIVAALQGILTNLQEYATDPNNWASTILDIPIIGQLVVSMLPSLALIICLILVPIILKLVATKVIKLPAQSAVDFDVGKKMFLFTFVIIFLGNTLFNAASSGGEGGAGQTAQCSSSIESIPVLCSLEQVFSQPDAQSLLTWIGTAVANSSAFFLSFIFTKGLLAGGTKFLKLPKAIIYAIVSKISKSRRAEHRAYSKAYMSYGPAIPYHTIFFLIGLVFCVIQPFTPLFTLIYFLYQYFTERYDLLYILREPYQSGGMFWPTLHQQMFVGLVTFLAVNTGYMITLLFPPGIVIMAVMLGLTIPYYAAIQGKYARPMKMLSIHAAADLDRADTKFDWLKDLTPEEEHLMVARGWDTEEATFGPIEDRYKQPSLKVRDDDHQTALRQGQLAHRLVGSYNDGDPVPEEIRDEPDEYGNYPGGTAGKV